MPEDWLDGLSEEWPSQPPSEAGSAFSHSRSQSRIPQLRSSLGTYPSANAKQASNPRRRSVLSDRSANVQSPASSTSRTGTKLSRPSVNSRSISESSNTSVVQIGTTQVHKLASTSPAKDDKGYETPEWKRRLVQGRVGYDEPVDLFSPMGLEKMFAKPSSNSIKGVTRKTRKMPASTGRQAEPPSSPPIFNPTRENTFAEELHDDSELAPVQESHEEYGDERQEPVHNMEKELQQSHFLEQPKSEQDTKISSQSEESSGFSPVFISKHQDAKGSIRYAALDVSKTELEEQLQKHRESLQQSQQQQQQQIAPSVQVHQPLSESSDSLLPDDLPTGTPDTMPLSNFVNVRRGGLSAEGSFKRRPLSPSPLSRPYMGEEDDSIIPQSSALPADGDMTIDPTETEIRPPAPTPPAIATPSRAKQTTAAGGTRDDSSLSPLKLFGDHDTYTSKRLHRRLSQLELHDQPLQEESLVLSEASATEDASQIDDTPRDKRQPSCGSRFGSGQLDAYEFPEVSVLSEPASEEDAGQLRSRSPSPSQMPPGAKAPFKFRVGSGSSDVYDTFKNKRKTSKMSNRSGSLTVSKRSANSTQRGFAPQQPAKLTVDMGSVSYVSEGKRPLTPFLDPTPKRRRTLIFADEDEEIPARSMMSTLDSHDRMQSVVGRKRKDARHSNTSNQADPDTLAKRHILRPRNPTPSQRRQEQIEQEILEATQDFLASSPKLQSIREHLRPPIIHADDEDPESSRLMAEEEQARAVAEEVAAFSVRIAKGMKDEGRKRSVTTQDFLDEAMKIMDFIRTKRPTSALSSLEETDEDRLNEQDEQQDKQQDEPTQLLSSPQAERNGWRQRDEAQLDSSVVNHLRQFADNDDPFVASSWSIHHGHQNEDLSPVHEDLPESDPPGIRIIENPMSKAEHKRQNSKDEQTCKSSSMPSHKSHASVDSSLGRTTMTSTSRKSEKVATIAPSNVAHLIGKEVNGMHFDEQKQTWVRSKSLSPTKDDVQRDVSGMTGSEEDPFGEIPDLTVDEDVEMERVSASPSRPVTASSVQWAERQFRLSQAEQRLQDVQKKEQLECPSVAKTSVQDEKVTSAYLLAVKELELPDEDVHSVQKAPARASSVKKAPFGPRPQSRLAPRDEQVEREYSIHDRQSSPSKQYSTRRISQLHISISSPAGPRQQTDPDSLRRKPSTAYRNRELPPLPSQHGTTQGRAKQALEAVNEHHEVSIIDYGANDRRVNFSVSVSAPLAVAESSAPNDAAALPSPARVDSTYATFLMSELDDFTIHQPEELDQPTREIVKASLGKLVCVEENRFENSNTALLKALQDLESQEPFWEELRQIALPSRNLTSMHLLDVLCEGVHSIDVSDNAIAQVAGAPYSVRSLDISNNLLSGLTCWASLTNLQYLNVSGNDIDTLDAFACLVHLRELRADDNRIESLRGVSNLDGLLTLSLKRNRVQELELDGCKLFRLEKLDLEGNQLGGITQFRDFDQLPRLQELNLDRNDFSDLRIEDKGICPALTSLSLRGNRLTSLALSASALPAMRRLNVDDNQLSSFSDIWTLALDHLSARRQQPRLGQCMNPRLLHDLTQVRSIALSGTHIPTISLPSDGLPYLRRLEMASCGLQCLPQDFGRQVPGLSFLNLGHNHMSDVAPLLGCKAIDTLLLANNRFSRLRKVVAVLERIGRRMTTLDVRGNPIVHGFHGSEGATTGTADSMQLAHPCSALDRLDRSVQGRNKVSGGEKEADSDGARYILAAQDADTDKVHRSRLDNDTAMRRRVYEILLSNALLKLQRLDGLEFCRREVQGRDDVWMRLESLGIIRMKQEA